MSVVAFGEHTVAATAKVLTTSESTVGTVLVQPLAANTDAATHFGGSGVATTTGFPVAKGTTQAIGVNDLSDLYVVGTTAGDKVRWLAVERD